MFCCVRSIYHQLTLIPCLHIHKHHTTQIQTYLLNSRYRKLSVSFHPDKNIGSDEEREMADKAFKDIAVAFEVLGR